jgi:hypothetical protein
VFFCWEQISRDFYHLGVFICHEPLGCRLDVGSQESLEAEESLEAAVEPLEVVGE